MKEATELPAFPSLSRETVKSGQKRRTGPLKPESPWATRIRKLLISDQDGRQYVPYMPVKNGRSLLRALRKVTGPVLKEPSSGD